MVLGGTKLTCHNNWAKVTYEHFLIVPSSFACDNMKKAEHAQTDGPNLVTKSSLATSKNCFFKTVETNEGGLSFSTENDILGAPSI